MTAPFVAVSEATRNAIEGGLNDDVQTGAAPLPPRDVEGRTAALSTLFDYFCELTFYRTGGKGKAPYPFRLTRSECHIEWPENVENIHYPSIGVLAGDSDHDPIGLSPVVDESTKDRFGCGTALWRLWDYKEVLQLEVWASSRAERRALVEGLQQALSPSESVSNLRLLLPTYFNQRASYTLLGAIRADDGAAKNRRRAVLRMELRYDVVRLARYAPMSTFFTTQVVDADTPDNDPARSLDPIARPPRVEDLPPVDVSTQ